MEKYYLYIDECGDQNLAAFNPKFPVFTLCGIALDRTQLTALECRMNAVKERFWGTRDVLFHSYEMRSHVGPFKNFCDEQVLLEFYRDIDAILTATDAFVIVSCTILKEPFIRQFGCLGDVYAQSLSVLLERSIFYVDDRSEEGGAQDVILEMRGGKEDGRLRRFCDELLTKGTYWVTPERENKVFDLIRDKIYISDGNLLGLKLLPKECTTGKQ